MKRGIQFILVFIVIIVLLSINSSFVIAQVPECGNDRFVILRLSSSTNAHAELATQIAYKSTGQPICFNELFPSSSYVPDVNSHTCNANNLVLKLSSSTNANAEDPSRTAYTTNVCYSGLKECELATTSSCPAGKTSVVRLSFSTNAHLEKAAPPLIYTNIICCKAVTVSPPISPTVTEAYWANEVGSNIEGQTVEISNKVKLIAKVAGLPPGSLPGAQIRFEIYEKDLGGNSLIAKPAEVVPADATGVASVIWTISESDFIGGDSTELNDQNDRILELIFKASIQSLPSANRFSGELKVTKIAVQPPQYTGCKAYNQDDYILSLNSYNAEQNEKACNEDTSSGRKRYKEEGEYNAVYCNQPGTTCSCKWNNNLGCAFDRTDTVNPPGGSACSYSCQTGYQYGECSNDQQTLDSKRVFSENPSNCINALPNGEEKDRAIAERTKCVNEQTQIFCGAPTIILPLFGTIQFLISMTTLALIYIILLIRNIKTKKSSDF